ncbi:MAG: MBL fold metallo-hydrolase [Candidatus Margulisiibacteriota bacterium]
MSEIKKVTFLGTGTSFGMPEINCDCRVCTSDNPKNTRSRCSILLELDNEKNIIVDTSIDFRQQCLKNKVKSIDAILITHCHADHVFGLDDTRKYHKLQKTEIPCYAEYNSAEELRRIFNYAFGAAKQTGGGVPGLDLKVIDGPFKACGLPIIPMTVMHGIVPITAFRLGNIAYVTDCSQIPEESYALLNGLDVLILDALRITPHPTHFNLEEAIEAAQRIGAKKTYFTHIAHQIEHEKVSRGLPDGIDLAYDGLVIVNSK